MAPCAPGWGGWGRRPSRPSPPDRGRSTRRTLGLFASSVVTEGDTGRRSGLFGDVRAVLADGTEPTPRIAALLYGSGTLPQLHPDIPWSAQVITRVEEFKDGSWGAGAAAEASTRTNAAVIVNNMIAATAALPRG